MNCSADWLIAIVAIVAIALVIVCNIWGSQGEGRMRAERDIREVAFSAEYCGKGLPG